MTEETPDKTSSQQVGEKRDSKGRFDKGHKPTGGFHVTPEHRSSGAWKKEDTPRFKLEEMMKLSSSELEEIGRAKTAPLFERKLATAINKGQWKEIREMIHEIYGKPRETLDVTTKRPLDQETIHHTVSFILGDDK